MRKHMLAVMFSLVACSTDPGEAIDAGPADAPCRNAFDLACQTCGHLGEFCCWDFHTADASSNPADHPPNLCLEGVCVEDSICMGTPHPKDGGGVDR